MKSITKLVLAILTLMPLGTIKADKQDAIAALGFFGCVAGGLAAVYAMSNLIRFSRMKYLCGSAALNRNAAIQDNLLLGALGAGLISISYKPAARLMSPHLRVAFSRS